MGVSLRAFLFSAAEARGEGEGEDDEEDGQSCENRDGGVGGVGELPGI